MSKCEECKFKELHYEELTCRVCVHVEDKIPEAIDNFEPKQPEILTAKEWFYKTWHSDHENVTVPAGVFQGAFRDGDKNGQRKLYFQGGYKEFFELIEEHIHLLELHGRITPLDVEIKAAFENLKKPE